MSTAYLDMLLELPEMQQNMPLLGGVFDVCWSAR